MVGDFLRTEQESLAKDIHVAVHYVQCVIGQAQRRTCHVVASTLKNQVDDRVLDHLGEHREGGHVGIVAQGADNGIGHIAHTALERKEFLRDAAALQLADEEVGYVGADGTCVVVQRLESGLIVAQVGVNHGNDLLRVNLHVDGADAVSRMRDHERLAVRRHFGQINIVHTLQTVAVGRIQLDDDLVGMSHKVGHDAHRCRGDEVAVGKDLAGLDDGDIHLAEESVIDVLTNHREVAIEILHLAAVDGLAHVGIALEWCAELDGMGQWQFRIDCRARGSASNQTDLEWTACLMFLDCILGDGCGNRFRDTYR